MRSDSAAAVGSVKTSVGDAVGDTVSRALAGDRDAETEVCRRLLPAIRAFARRRLRPAAAEDFAQDALVLVLEALRGQRVREPERVASFALGICRNLARERARNGERRRELLAQFGLTDADFIVFDNHLELRREHLEDCFSQLTERSRDVIRATFCDEEDDAPIAAKLAISASNVRVIRHRSLAALRTCLEKPISWEGSR
ncbi:MAG: polymerase sigma factor [Labilithrix sp.]|nr:polymerase sigma factor [Labilithrix sp.]